LLSFRRLAATIALGPLALGMGLGLTSAQPALAATIPPKITLDSDDLSRPIVLDQQGRFVDTKTSIGTSTASATVPTYVGYLADSDDALPKGYPTIETGPRVAGQTVGPLHLTAATQGQLNSALAQNGEAVVHAADHTMLVKPASSVAAGSSSLSAWLAGQAASGTSTGTPVSTTTTQSQNLAQLLNLDGITKPITNSSVMKDLNHLLTLKSGKFVNWNQQSLDALKRDLSLTSPKHVATHPLTTGTTTSTTATTTPSSPATAAQMLDSPGTVMPAPIPEPSTYLIFSLAAGAFVVRRRLRSSPCPTSA
jgi:hypothetical protein